MHDAVYLKFCLTPHWVHTVVNHCPRILICLTWFTCHILEQAGNMLIHFYFMALYKNKYAVEATAALMQHASSPVRSASLCVWVKILCILLYLLHESEFNSEFIQDSWQWTVTAAETIQYRCEKDHHWLQSSFRVQGSLILKTIKLYFYRNLNLQCKIFLTTQDLVRVCKISS